MFWKKKEEKKEDFISDELRDQASDMLDSILVKAADEMLTPEKVELGRKMIQERLSSYKIPYSANALRCIRIGMELQKISDYDDMDTMMLALVSKLHKVEQDLESVITH